VVIASHTGRTRATQVSDEINRCFDITTTGVATGTHDELRDLPRTLS
jgi:methylene-tetrahydromethanopterin dehydrogenase